MPQQPRVGSPVKNLAPAQKAVAKVTATSNVPISKCILLLSAKRKIYSLILREALNNVSEAVRARQKSVKKRSLQVVNEHFELIFNNALTT